MSTNTRSYYTFEENGKERKVELDGTPVDAKKHQRLADLSEVDPITGTAIDENELERQEKEIGRLEEMAEKADPWILKDCLNALREAWYNKPDIPGLPQPAPPTPMVRERAKERTKRIADLEKRIDQRMATWTPKNETKQNSEASPERKMGKRRQILQLDNPQVAAQWKAARQRGWIKTLEGYTPWEDGSEICTIRGKSKKGAAAIAFMAGIIYAKDYLEENSEGKSVITHAKEKYDFTDIWKELAPAFGLEDWNTLRKIRYTQEGNTTKEQGDICDELSAARSKVEHLPQRERQ